MEIGKSIPARGKQVLKLEVNVCLLFFENSRVTNAAGME